MPQEWKLLPLGRHGTCPPLFFRFIYSSTGYEISLTDLVYIWSESLNHKEILARASKIETSIDPSEDKDQFLVLLQKVQDTLRGAKGCTVSLNQSTKGHGLDLVTTTKLPSPLEPLDWTLHLSRLPKNALTRQILIPILKGEANRAARIQSLIDLLKEKDLAMYKIFEKVESSGLDISRTFPGLSGPRGERKGPALAQVSKVVRGVAPFDERDWNSSFAAGELGEDTGMNFATELDSVHSYRDWDAVQSALLEEWWVRLESGVSSGDKPKSKAARKAFPQPQRPTDKEDSATSGSDDEFQRQATPPRLKRALLSTSANNETNRRAKSPENQTANSDSESNEQTRPSPSPPPQKQKPARKGLGTISAKSKKRPASKVDESTTSESEAPEPPAKAQDSKPKGLGRISKPKSTAQSIKPTAESTASENSDSGEPTKKKTAPSEDVATASDSDKDAKPPAPSKGKQADPKEDDKEVSDVDIRLPFGKPPKSRIGGGLGQIGAKKRKDQRQQESKQISPESEDYERENENTRARANEKRQSPPAAAAEPSSPKPKRAGKLGMISGRKSARKATTDPQPVKSHEKVAGQETASGIDDENTRRASPLKKPKKEETSQDQLRLPRPRSPSAPTRRSAWSKEPKREEEETAEERANRKREELRRQMETKAPAKKKRRF